jgi:polysaccharide pyruvyl transferase WcaK-like protein
MKRIFLWGGWSRNYGDLAIYDSQTTLFRELDPNIEFVPINSDIIRGVGPQLTPAMIDAINNSGDMLMVGAGGQLMYRTPETSVSGWQFNVEKECLNMLKVPLVVYGIGFNEFPFGPRIKNEISVSHVNFVANKSSLFSVRNRGTRTRLKAWGIKRPIDVIPDPAMFMKTYRSDLIDSLCDIDAIRIGVCWAGDGFRDRFGLCLKRPIIEKICTQIKKFAGGKKFKVFYIPHVEYCDIPDEGYFKEHLTMSSFCYVPDYVPNYFPETATMVRFVASLYEKMDIVVGFRGHSNIIPYGLGTPYVGVGDHVKNRFFSEMTGFPTVKTEYFDQLADAMNKAINKQIFGTTRYKNLVKSSIDFNMKVLELLYRD